MQRPQFPLVPHSACWRIRVRMHAEIWERSSKLRVLLCQHFLCLGFTARPSAKRRARVYFWSQREGKRGEKGGKKLEKLQDNHGGWRFWTQTYQYGFVVLVGYGLPCDAFLFIFFLFHQKNVLKGNDMENVIIRFMEWQIKSCWKHRQSPWSNVAFKWFVTSAALSFPHYRQINLVKVVKLNDHIFLYVYFLSLYWQRQSKLRLQSIKLELTPHKCMTKNMKHFNMCTYQTIFLYKY